MPLEQWIKDGWVRTCDGDMNSTAQLSKDLHDLIDAKQENGRPLYNVRSIGYDPFHSRPFMTTFNEETSIECIEVKASLVTHSALCRVQDRSADWKAVASRKSRHSLDAVERDFRALWQVRHDHARKAFQERKDRRISGLSVCWDRMTA